MGSAFKAIGGAIGGVIKQVAPAVIKAIAPAATSLLSKITDGFVSKGADFLKTALAKLPLPDAFKALGDKLIGKGADMLKQLGGGLVEKGLSKLMELVSGRQVDGQNVNLPGLATPARQAAIQANSPSVASNSAAATTGNGGTSGTGSAGPSGAAGGASMDRAPNPENYDMDSIKGQAKYNADSMKFQQQLTNMQTFFKAQSDILAGAKDVANKISANFR